MITCSFCGHSRMDIPLKEPLVEIIEKLIIQYHVTCFYVGNHGEYDRSVACALKEMKKRFRNIQCYIVLAYIPGLANSRVEGDELPTIYPDGLETVPFRYAITHRNRWMVNHSDYVIAYITHCYGGAWQTFQYAKSKKKIQIYNLADDMK